MEVIWFNSSKSLTVPQSWNDGNYIVCNFSNDAYSSSACKDISYFTFCQNLLRQGFSEIQKSNKDLILLKLDLEKLGQHRFELLYLVSMIIPLDPIIIGEKLSLLENMFSLSFKRFVSYDPSVNFTVDLEKGISEMRKTFKSEIATAVSIFNAHGLLLSFGQKFNTVIKMKENVGLPISYDEFMAALVSERDNAKKYPTWQTFYKNISQVAFVREHNPVDLFIDKMLKSK